MYFGFASLWKLRHFGGWFPIYLLVCSQNVSANPLFLSVLRRLAFNLALQTEREAGATWTLFAPNLPFRSKSGFCCLYGRLILAVLFQVITPENLLRSEQPCPSPPLRLRTSLCVDQPENPLAAATPLHMAHLGHPFAD